MTDPDEERQPIDVALDLLFYAPLGLALTAAEEMPKLAEKGRRRFTTQWSTAKVVGRFAVDQGRKQAGARFNPPRARSAVPDPAAPRPPVPSPRSPTVPGPDPTLGQPSSNGAPTAPASEPPPAVDELAIPGYDSLSASQVVQRLAGLAPGELDAVRRYEAGTRRRRTILTRVAQLQSP